MGLGIRRVVGGEIFDTSADVLTIARHQVKYGDLNRDVTRLFRTRKGQWFLAGDGGAPGLGCQPSDRRSDAQGERLRLLSADEARQLLEEQDGDVETYLDVEDADLNHL